MPVNLDEWDAQQAPPAPGPINLDLPVNLDDGQGTIMPAEGDKEPPFSLKQLGSDVATSFMEAGLGITRGLETALVRGPLGLFPAGTRLNQWMDENGIYAPPSSLPHPGLVSKLYEGGGSLLGFMMGGEVTQALGGGLGAIAATQGALGAISSAGQQREEAEMMGGTPEQQALAALGGAAVGSTEALSGGWLFNRLNKATGGALFELTKKVPLNAAPSLIKDIVEGFAVEGGQEGLQQIGGNLVASDVAQYDPDRSPLLGFKDAVLVGGLLGSGAASLANMAERKYQEKTNAQMEEARQIKLAMKNPINDFEGSITPLYDLLSNVEAAQEAEGTITPTADAKVDAFFTPGGSPMLPSNFVTPEEQISNFGAGPEHPKPDLMVDAYSTSDKKPNTLRNIVETDQPVIPLMKTETSDRIAELQAAKATIPQRFSEPAIIKAEEDYADAHIERLRVREKKEKALSKAMYHYATKFVKVFGESAFEGVTLPTTHLVLDFQQDPTGPSIYSGKNLGRGLFSRNQMQTSRGVESVDTVEVNMRSYLDSVAPRRLDVQPKSKAQQKAELASMFMSYVHELGHWMSFRHLSAMSNDIKALIAHQKAGGTKDDLAPEIRRRAGMALAIQSDYMKFIRNRMNQRELVFLAMQRGTARGLDEARTAFMEAPRTQLVHPSRHDQEQRDYMYGYVEYLAHRMERALSKATPTGVESALAEAVKPGYFKRLGGEYEKQYGLLKKIIKNDTDVYGIEAESLFPHAFDNFIQWHQKEAIVDKILEQIQAGGSKGFLDALKGKIPGFDPRAWGGAQEHLDNFTNFHATAINILQAAWLNPHIQGLQKYTDLVAHQWAPYRKQVEARTMVTIKKWRRLGKESANKISNVLMQEAEIKERFTPQQLSVILTEAEMEVHAQIRRDLDFILEEMRTESLVQARRKLTDNEEMLNQQVQKINQEFDAMRDKGYFPFMRFGKYLLEIRADHDLVFEGVNYKKGALISWEAFDKEHDRDRAAVEWPKMQAGLAAKKSLQTDAKWTIQGVPSSLLSVLQEKVSGSGVPQNIKDELEKALKESLPVNSFRRHLLRKRGIRGFSQDFQRAYASYMRNAAGHLGRVKYADELQGAIRQVGQDVLAINASPGERDSSTRRRIYNWMNQHYQYVLTPQNELQGLRSALFQFFLGFNIKSASINLLQIPQIGMPYLASQYGDLKAAGAIIGATKEVVSSWSRQDAWVRSTKSGFDYRLTYVMSGGNIDAGGTHFSSEGPNVILDPDTPGAKFFDLSDTKILDAQNPEQMGKFLDLAIRTEKAELVPDKAKIAELEAAKEDISKTGFSRVDFGFLQKAGLTNILQSAGYDGVSVLEAHGQPQSTIFVRHNLKKAKEISRDAWTKRRDRGASRPDTRRAELLEMKERGEAEGWLDQSLGMEIALASSENTNRLLPVNLLHRGMYKMAEMGALPFHVTEKMNRHVMAFAAYNLARDGGLSQKAAIVEARLAIEKTMFAHENWNRPVFMRGKKSVFTVFQGYVQNVLWFATRGDAASMRFLLGLALMSGLYGMPGAQDLEDMIDFLLTQINLWTGQKDPKVQIREEMREKLNEMGLHPDLILHGLAQQSFGIPALGDLVGIPVPSFDLSGSVGMGNIIPGTGAPETAQTAGFDAAAMQALSEVGGAGANAAEDMFRAFLSDDPNDWKRMEKMLPVAMKNASKAARYAVEGQERMKDGTVIAEFDPFEPKDAMEIAGQALGFTPSSVPAGWERALAAKDMAAFYTLRRQKVMLNYAHARYTGDRESIADARAGIEEYNRIVPFIEMGIKGEEAKESAERYRENQTKNSMGIETGRYHRLRERSEARHDSPQEGTGDKAGAPPP